MAEVTKVKSGKIEIINNGLFTILQYNAACEDVHKFCKGVCCSMRNVFNAQLAPDELDSYKHIPHPIEKGAFILATDDTGTHCYYHDKQTGFCTIYATRPAICRTWHCSPGGKGPELTQHGDGWVLVPLNQTTQDKRT